MNEQLEILHLEDNDLDAEIIQNILQEEGIECSITKAASKKEYFSKIHQYDYDIILSDNALPDYDGLSALKYARKHKPHIPFIFVSGTIGEERAVEALRYGARDYVLKKHLNKLAPAIQRIIHESEIEKARIRAENELRESEEKYRRLVNEVSDGFYITDGQSVLIFSNNSLAKMLGFNKVEEVIGHNFVEFIPKNKVAEFTRRSRNDNDIESQKLSNGFEVEIRRFDGQTAYLEMTSNIIQENDKIIGMRGVIRDITERKKAEINLKRRDAILEVISISAEKFLIAKNINEPINDTLRLLCEATDASRVYIFKLHHSDDGKPLTSQTHEYVKEGITPQIDNSKLQNLDIISAGYNRWLKTFEKHEPIVGLVKNFPDSEIKILRDQNIQSIVVTPIYVFEKLYGFIGFDECLYERIWSKPEIEALHAVANLIAGAFVKDKIERELVAAKEKSEEMNRLKSIFLSNMSHELRTPLISVLGFAELLQQELKNPEHLGFVNNIIEGGQRLNNTLSGILEISGLETANPFVNFHGYNLADVINTKVKLLLPMAQSKLLFLKTELSDAYLHAHIDGELFGKALYHLVNNGIKFTKRGGVFVTLNHERKQDHDWAVTKVIDTGVGIPKENFDKIFDAFRQSDEGYGRSHEGAGLGLTIAKKVVGLMKGKIEVESEVGKGSVFSIWLPAIPNQNQIQQRIKKKLTTTIVQPYTSKEKGLQKILVVEDNPSNRMLINRFLSGRARIVEVKDGISGVTFASKERFDLILMDINLGAGIDGVEAMHQIRKIPGYIRVPIIAATAYVMFGDKERFLSEGFDDYLAKPFTRDALLNLVEKCLARAKKLEN